MSFKINIEENKYFQKFFKKYGKYEELIKNNIKTILPVLILEKPYKIKTAYGYKYNGKLIYEYKIKLDKYLDCRVAYTLENNEIEAFFISTVTIKKDFVNELVKLSEVYHD